MFLPWADAIYRTYQGRGLVQRARYEALRRLGVYERHRKKPVPATRLALPVQRLESVRAFYARHPASREHAITQGDVVLAGCLPMFGRSRAMGFPPEWHRHPVTDAIANTEHWSKQSDTGELGDIKWLWEPARFGGGIALARAFVASDDSRYAAAFDEMFRDFVGKNPAYFGIHWMSGQECALRAIAIVFAASALQSAGAPLPTDLLKQFLYDSGRRVAASLDYALSQRNNHALSELAGLWLCAQALRDIPERAAWQKLVNARLPGVLADQFAADGSYIQESMSYHRLALGILLVMAWAEMPDPQILHAIERSTDYLAHFACTESGRVPNLGSNDGALLFPLSACPHGDYRPALQHAQARTKSRRLYEPGPWDEEAAWFGTPLWQPSRPGVRGPLSLFPSGNLCSFRGRSRLYLRAPEHNDHRPSHADTLHVDLWLGAKNLALDPGTYLYSGAPPWQNALAETRYHNTCSVGNGSQMVRHGRFFWTRWSRAELLGALALEDATVYHARTFADADHHCDHERFVVHTANGALVLDRMRSDFAAPLRLHWNLPPDFLPAADRILSDGKTRVVFASEPTERLALVCADEATPLGWQSLTYGEKTPCAAVELETHGTAAHFFTWFSWAEDRWLDGKACALWSEWRAGATGQSLVSTLQAAQ